jgi:hypothetical protein
MGGGMWHEWGGGGYIKWIRIFGTGRDLLECLVLCGAVGITGDLLEYLVVCGAVGVTLKWIELAWFRVGQGLL